MFKIIDGKDSGKTRKLIEEASQNNGVIVCRNAYSTKVKAVAYGFYSGIDKIMTYGEFIEELENLNNENIYIDELEDFMNYYLYSQSKIKSWGYTMSKEN